MDTRKSPEKLKHLPIMPSRARKSNSVSWQESGAKLSCSDPTEFTPLNSVERSVPCKMCADVAYVFFTEEAINKC